MLLNKILIALVFICVASILGISDSNTVNAAHNTTTAKIINTNNTDNGLNIIVNAKFRDQHQLLIINSSQFDNIDTQKLRTELGHNNVVTDEDLDQITVNLKNCDKAIFHIYFKNVETADLKISDTDQNILDQQVIKKDAVLTSEDNYTSWKEHKTLKVSYGSPSNEKLQSDGTKLIPVIYFGSIDKALLNNYSIAESLKKENSRSYRKNNITAANSGVIIKEKDGSIKDYFTNTSGDGIAGTNDNPDDNKQSIGNFVTSNLYNYRNQKNKATPNIIGPDYNLKQGFFEDEFNTGIKKGSVHFYTRNNLTNNLEEQRLVFEQQYLKDRIWPRPDQVYKIQIQITQSFTEDNKIKTRIDYKNIGTENLPNFSGYVFKNITFNNKNISHQDEILSLGENKGLYGKNNELGAQFEMLLKTSNESPYAWILTQKVPTYFGDDGTPFKNDKSINFTDVNDRGFSNASDPGFARPFLNPEGSKKFTTVVMHTKDKALNRSEETSMEYISSFDIKEKKHPNITLKDVHDESHPEKIDNNAKTYQIQGNWFDHLNENIDLYYTVGAQKIDKATKLKNLTQTKDQRDQGLKHQLNLDIPISKLPIGKHKIKIFAKANAINNDDTYTSHRSKIIETNIHIQPRKTDPEIVIKEPVSDYLQIFETTANKINVSGTWMSNLDETYQLAYSIDNKPIEFFEENAKNTTRGKDIEWDTKVPIQYINDQNVHELQILLMHQNKIVTTDFFSFKRNQNYFKISQETSMDFGVVHAVQDKQYIKRPKIDGRIEITDARQDKTKPLELTLQTQDMVDPTNAAKLLSTVSFKNQFVHNGGSLLIGRTKPSSESSKIVTSDFTKILEKELILKFNHSISANNSDFAQKNYLSKWKFIATEIDSIG